MSVFIKNEEKNKLKNNIRLFTNNIIFNGFNTTTNPANPSMDKFIKETPTIPGLYFIKDCNSTSDLNNNKIIDKYFEIQRNIENLEKVKNNILEILEMSKSIMINKIISNEQYHLENKTYGIDKKNRLIIKFTNNKKNDYTSNFKKQVDFKNFINELIKENYNIFRNIDINTNIPYFFYIFQNEFSDKSVNYFLNLFRKYNNIRDKLSDDIRNNCGILGFKSFFDIDFNTQKIRNNFEKNIKKNNNKINYNKYILEGNCSNNNTYLNENNPESNPIHYLKSKIHQIDLLYLTFIDKEYIKNKHRENCYKIYEDLHDSLNKVVGNSAKYNLYDITRNMIELDCNIFKFVYFYIEPELFNNVVDNHYKVKGYISKHINKFEQYFDLFAQWRKTIEGKSNASIDLNKLFVYDDFDTVYKEIIKLIKMP